MQNKIILWVVSGGILLLLVVGGIGYFLTKQTSEVSPLVKQAAQQNSPAVDTPLDSPVQQTTPATDTPKNYRNENYGFELRYADPILIESTQDHFFAGPVDKKFTRSGATVDIYERLEGNFATSSYLSLDELKSDLEKQGYSPQLKKVGSLPVLVIFDEETKVILFLKNEFEYSITDGAVTKIYSPEDAISGMTFFTKHSPEEIVAIIKNQREQKTYRNEQWGFSLVYPGSNTLEIMHSNKSSIELRIYNLMGYNGANIHLTATPPLSKFTLEEWKEQITEGTTEEKINGTSVYLQKDPDSTTYYFTKENLFFSLWDTNPLTGTSRIKDIFMGMKFFTPRG